MKTLLLLALAVLSGCVSTPEKIVATPTGSTLPIPITSPTLIAALQADAYNLDQAVVIGALAKDDPAPACLHDFLQKAGIEIPPGGTAPASFAPKPEGKASILYIQVQQAKSIAGGGIKVSTPCLALIGQLRLDEATAAARGAEALLPIKLPGGLLAR